MGGVGNDHIRLGDVGHHPLGGHLPHQTPHPGLDPGVAFHLAHLFLYFLFGHPQAFFEPVTLMQIVQASQDQENRQDAPGQAHPLGLKERGQVNGVLQQQCRQVRQQAAQADISQATDGRRLGQGFAKFRQGLPGKQSLEAV
jgi:hypothetical protein